MAGSRILIKDEEETSWSYGRRVEERSIEEHLEKGVVNLDKPPGPTSHEVAAWVRKLLGVKRVGHGGTLEP
jgi:tRNA U55 pseudouridine synthase TruB